MDIFSLFAFFCHRQITIWNDSLAQTFKMIALSFYSGVKGIISRFNS